MPCGSFDVDALTMSFPPVVAVLSFHQSQLSPSASLHVSLEVPALDVSLVDGRPQELLLLSMDGLVAEYHAGNSAGVAYTQVSTAAAGCA